MSNIIIPFRKIETVQRRDLPFERVGHSVFQLEPEATMIYYEISDKLFDKIKLDVPMDWMGYIVHVEVIRIIHRVVLFGNRQTDRPDGDFSSVIVTGVDGEARLITYTETNALERFVMTATSEDFLTKLGVVGRMAFE